MIFPFWYTGEAVFYKSDEESSAELIKNIVLNNKGDDNHEGSYVFRSRAGIFGLHTIVKLKFDTWGPTIHVKYTTSLFESNIILLFSLVLGSFLFFNDKFFLSYIVFIAGILGYLGNTIKANNYAKTLISPLGSFLQNVEEQELWEKQKLWTNDPEVCSACGEPINKYAAKCINCGLHFTKNNRAGAFSPSTNTANANINYKINTAKK